MNGCDGRPVGPPWYSLRQSLLRHNRPLRVCDLEPADYSLVVRVPGFEEAVSTVLAGRGRADRRRAGASARLCRGDDRGDGYGESPTLARTISTVTRERYLQHRNRGGTIAPRSRSPIWPLSTRRPCAAAGSRARLSWKPRSRRMEPSRWCIFLAPVDLETMTTVYPDLARWGRGGGRRMVLRADAAT